MKQTWRWFGPRDRVSIDAMLQAGVEGVVSALHHIPTGVIWSRHEIEKRQLEIATRPTGEPSGLKWEVVESLPVSEDIKRQSGDCRAHIAAWKQSLHNLHDAGIKVVCYNFMPVLDWTRTDLAFQLPNGATCMRFDLPVFAAFDIHILRRKGAADDYAADIVKVANSAFARMTEDDKKSLLRNVVFGLPGAAENFSLDDLKYHLAAYSGLGEDRLRANLIDFLSEVAPVAQTMGMRLCCHPDNDLPSMMENLGDRVHFLHLRNVKRESLAILGSFHEVAHLEGDTDMVALVAAVLRQEAKRRAQGREDISIPFRPDHGQNILDDLGRNAQPGYPSIGRLKGLAELRGIITALTHASVRGTE